MTIKVLVIDDDVPSTKMLQWAMEEMGHEVEFAFNGASALKKAQVFIPDVVICDLNMPKIQGYEVCMRMKADARFADTLFIALTGMDTARAKELTARAGFKYHVVKPINFRVMQEMIAKEKPEEGARSAS